MSPSAENAIGNTHTHTLRSPARSSLAATLLATALLLGGCADQAEDPVDTPSASEQTEPDEQQTPPAEPAPEESSEADEGAEGVAGMAFTECEAERYTVGYPAGWSSNGEDGLLGPCEIFHPGEIEVAEQPRDMDLHWAAVLYVDEVAFEVVAGAEVPGELLAMRETAVEGRAARVVEYRSSGEGLVPEGESSYTWQVDLGGEVLVAPHPRWARPTTSATSGCWIAW